MTRTTVPPITVEDVAIDDLRPDPANPRRIRDDELDALERGLRQFGFVQPVLARREDRTVIDGHQRLVAARRLGLTSVPVGHLGRPAARTGAPLGARAEQDQRVLGRCPPRPAPR